MTARASAAGKDWPRNTGLSQMLSRHRFCGVYLSAFVVMQKGMHVND